MRRGSASGSEDLRLWRNGAFAPGPNRGDPGPPPFYDLEDVANAAGPFSPSYTGRRLG